MNVWNSDLQIETHLSDEDSNFLLAITDLVPLEVLPFRYKKFAINIQLNERSELDEC
mgnify:CR=1 FL=1